MSHDAPTAITLLGHDLQTSIRHAHGLGYNRNNVPLTCYERSGCCTGKNGQTNERDRSMVGAETSRDR